MKISASRGLAALLAAFLAVAASTTPAAAQPSQGASLTEEQKETARGLMKSGRQKEAAGDLEGALADYQAADDLMAVPSTSLSVGQVLARLGRLVEARTALLRAARYPVTASSPAPLVEARDAASALADEVGARIPSLTITLAGAEGKPVTVELDGVALKESLVGRPVRVNPGTHRVRATYGEHVLHEAEVTLAERASETHAIVLDPAALAKLAPPPDPDPVPDSVPQPQPLPEPRLPPPDDAIIPVAGWVGVGLAAAGAIIGGVAGAIALVRTNDLDEACPDQRCSVDLRQEWDDANVAAHVSTAGFALAGAGAAVFVIALIVSSSESSDEARVPPLTWRF
jgi:hypothetical protein